MNLEYVEDLIERENIYLKDTYIEDSAGVYVNYRKINAILYDSNKLENSNEKKQVLAEELGHYYGDYTYKFNSDLQSISKQEYKAKKWAYNILIPIEKLKLALKNGIRDLYSLAEYFDVTTEYMYNAIDFYTNKYGLQMINCLI